MFVLYIVCSLERTAQTHPLGMELDLFWLSLEQCLFSLSMMYSFTFVARHNVV